MEERMKKETELGMNRTGMAMAPSEGKKQKENTWKSVPATPGDPLAARKVRAQYEAEAEPVGTMPAPASVKGAAKTAAQMIQGHDPKAFIDKIGERMAFERGGTRLYELLIGKFQAAASPTGEAELETLTLFRDQELAHFRLLWEALEKIGADPTVQTPSADHSGVKAQGLLQTIADARTTFCQALDAILIAELADNEGWRMLTELAEGMGQKEMASAFRQAGAEEETHLETIRNWTQGLILEEAGLAETAKS
jgi:hypothetical protein